MRQCLCCEKMLPEELFPRKEGDCQECCMKQFMIELYESPKSDKHFWKFRNWSVNVFDTRSVLEEDSEFLHLEILKKDMKIDIAIKKRANKDNQFQIWIGDKQFVIEATKNENKHKDCGKYISQHEALENIE